MSCQPSFRLMKSQEIPNTSSGDLTEAVIKQPGRREWRNHARVGLRELFGRRRRVPSDVLPDKVSEEGHRERCLGLELGQFGLGRRGGHACWVRRIGDKSRSAEA